MRVCSSVGFWEVLYHPRKSRFGKTCLTFRRRRKKKKKKNEQVNPQALLILNSPQRGTWEKRRPKGGPQIHAV